MNIAHISASVLPTSKTAYKAAIEEAKTQVPFLINLNPEQRKTIRKMGSKRVTYVNDVFELVSSNPGIVPAGFDMVGYLRDHQLGLDIDDMISWTITLFEGLIDTKLAIGNQEITQTDEAYDYAKVVAKKNPSMPISMAVKAISDQLKQGPRKKKPTPKPPVPPVPPVTP